MDRESYERLDERGKLMYLDIKLEINDEDFDEVIEDMKKEYLSPKIGIPLLRRLLNKKEDILMEISTIMDSSRPFDMSSIGKIKVDIDRLVLCDEGILHETSYNDLKDMKERVEIYNCDCEDYINLLDTKLKICERLINKIKKNV
jgi:hypothetical protein